MSLGQSKIRKPLVMAMSRIMNAHLHAVGAAEL